MKRLNTRFLMIVLGVFLASGITVHVVHGFQVKGQSEGFLRQARSLVDQVDLSEDRVLDEDEIDVLSKARVLYGRYLSFDHEKDQEHIDVLKEVVEVLKRLNDPRAAHANLESIVRLSPDDDEARRDFADYTFLLTRLYSNSPGYEFLVAGYYRTLQNQAQRLLKTNENDLELKIYLAAAQYGLDDKATAKKTLSSAVDAVDSESNSEAVVSVYKYLANLQYQDGEISESLVTLNECVDSFIDSNNASALAHALLNRGTIRSRLAVDTQLRSERVREKLFEKKLLKLGRPSKLAKEEETSVDTVLSSRNNQAWGITEDDLPSAETFIEHAIDLSWNEDGKPAYELEPKDFEVAFFAARSAMAYGQFNARFKSKQKPLQEARRILEEASENFSDNPVFSRLFADIEMLEGNPTAAIDHLEDYVREIERRNFQVSEDELSIRFNACSLMFTLLQQPQEDLNDEMQSKIVERIKNHIDRFERNLNHPAVESYRTIGIGPLVEVLKARKALWIDKDYEAALTGFEKVRYLKEVFVADFPRADVVLDIAETYRLLASVSNDRDKLDKGIEVLEAALRDEPFNTSYREGYAYLLMNSGRKGSLEAAESEYRRLFLNSDKSFELGLKYVGVMIRRINQIPVPERTPQIWNEANALLAQLNEIQQNHPEVLHLQAQVQMQQNNRRDARETIKKNLAANPENRASHEMKILLDIDEKDWDEALKSVDKAAEEFGDLAVWRILKSRIYSSKLVSKFRNETGPIVGDSAETSITQDEFRETISAIQLLGENLDELDAENRNQTHNGLMATLLSLRVIPGQYEQLSKLALDHAVALADDLTELSQDEEVALQRRILTLASEASDDETLDETLANIEARASTDDDWEAVKLYGKGLKLAGDALSGHLPELEGSGLEQAISFFTKSLERRPDWTEVRLKRARAWMLVDAPYSAISDFEVARLYSPASSFRMLLDLAKLYQETSQYQRSLSTLAAASNDRASAERGEGLQVLAQLSVLNDDYGRTFETNSSSSSIATKAKNPLWLASFYLVLAINETQREASESATEDEKIRFKERADLLFKKVQAYLDEAKADFEAHPYFWETQVRTLVAQDRKEDVESVLEDASSKVPEGSLHFMLARCHQITDQLQEAEEDFLSGLEQAQETTHLLTGLKEYSEFLSGQRRFEEALPVASRYAEMCLESSCPAPVTLEAHRNLAVIHAATSKPEGITEAIRQLDQISELMKSQTRPRDFDKITNKRLRAQFVYAKRDQQSHDKVIKIYEEMIQNRLPLSLDEKLRLASLYQEGGDEQKALDLARELAETGGPQYLAQYIGLLMTQGKLDEAEERLASLERLEPDSTATHRLILQIHFLQGEYDELIEHIDEVVARPDRLPAIQANILAWAATFSEVYAKELTGQQDQGYRNQLLKRAQNYFIELAELDPTKSVELAKFYARNGNVSGGLKEVASNYEEVDPNQLLVFVGLTLNAKPTKSEHADLLKMIEYIVDTGIEPVVARQIQAGLYVLQSQFDNAAKIYAEILDDYDADHETALNNLAMIKANHSNETKIAHDLIDRAISNGGEKANLFDTKGIVLLVEGNYDQAVIHLRKAVTIAPDPLRRVHLAYAYLQAKDVKSANDQFVQAQKEGLEFQEIDEWDEAYLEALKNAFSSS